MRQTDERKPRRVRPAILQRLRSNHHRRIVGGIGIRPECFDVEVDRGFDIGEESFIDVAVSDHDAFQSKRIRDKAAMQLKPSLDKMVPLYFGTDAGAVAAWHTATHVERSPKKLKISTPPTP